MKTSVQQLALTDAQLVVKYQLNKDNSSLGELYSRHFKAIYYYCLRITENHDSAFDITQDVFVKVAEKIDKLGQPQTFIAWIFRIAHNQSIDYCARQEKKRCYTIDDQFNLPDDSDQMEYLEEKEKRLDAVAELMDILSDDARLMLQLKYQEGYSIKDLQERFGLSESAVKMRLARAKDRIAVCYERRI